MSTDLPEITDALRESFYGAGDTTGMSKTWQFDAVPTPDPVIECSSAQHDFTQASGHIWEDTLYCRKCATTRRLTVSQED